MMNILLHFITWNGIQFVYRSMTSLAVRGRSHKRIETFHNPHQLWTIKLKRGKLHTTERDATYCHFTKTFQNFLKLYIPILCTRGTLNQQNLLKSRNFQKKCHLCFINNILCNATRAEMEISLFGTFLLEHYFSWLLFHVI